MVSLSHASQNNPESVEHIVHRLIGPTEHPRYGVDGTYRVQYSIPVDGLVVHTVCGKRIDGYPEVKNKVRRCKQCRMDGSKTPLDMLIRLLPPINTAGWSACYWDQHTPAQGALMLDRDGDVPGSPSRTSPPSLPW